MPYVTITRGSYTVRKHASTTATPVVVGGGPGIPVALDKGQLWPPTIRRPVHGAGPDLPDPGDYINGDQYFRTSDNNLFVLVDGEWVQPGIPELPLMLAVEGTLAVESGVIAVYAPYSGVLTRAHAAVWTPPVGADIVLDVNRNGTSIFTDADDRLVIPDGLYTTDYVVLAGNPDITTEVTAGDYFSVDVDQIGSGTEGANLTVQLLFAFTSVPS